jgi:hypothetical protein
MKFAVAASLASLALPSVSAHYLFGRLVLEGKVTDTWEYVREVAPKANTGDTSNTDPLIYPQTDPTSLDLRCGRNASTPFSTTKTAKVKAGDRIGFHTGEPHLEGVGYSSMYHPGFASAWLSKVPDGQSVDTYDGSGDWFKILQVVKREAQSLDYSLPEYKSWYDALKSPWGTYRVSKWEFNLPATTPPGQYLLRWEHIFPNKYNDAQFYPNCAQIEIANDGPVGTPGPLVKIPGVYTLGQPGEPLGGCWLFPGRC